jgi:tRNA1Val (adenine37-N6)-methyltransferase
MGNSWFRFKQFMVHQQKSAMKVTTDSCLFGALQPQFEEGGKGKNILDIGSGTGLLSLMAAQLNPLANITALEIDPDAAGEATDNVKRSTFKTNIKVLQQDVLTYVPGGQFHLIICNPPFHERQLTSPDKNRNKAHHSSTLQLNKLFPLAAKWLSKDSVFSLLLPFYREEEALNVGLEQGLFCQKLIRVRQSPDHSYFRSILFMGRQPIEKQAEEMVIRIENNEYSPAFETLLRPFYLNL